MKNRTATLQPKPAKLSKTGKRIGRPPVNGLTHTAEHRAWKNMLYRCTNPDHPAYPDYGGRGITVCDAWAKSFDAFLKDLGPRPAPGYWLERTNNDGPYSPSNCKWATPREQGNNRRDNVRLTLTISVAQWSAITGISQKLLAYRIKKGWGAKAALMTPVRAKRKRAK